MATLAATVADAQDSAPANTLVELGRQVSDCVGRHPLGPAGPQITVAFAMKIDGTVIGHPRIAFARLEGDADAQARFTAAVRRALDACLPPKITPEFGRSLAGRMFTLTLGRPSAPT